MVLIYIWHYTSYSCIMETYALILMCVGLIVLVCCTLTIINYITCPLKYIYQCLCCWCKSKPKYTTVPDKEIPLV